ncbi:hypothetical protein [Nostoc sp. 106C]|uniref:hypothetical protein n=1 Tax=Nostoc sp. 106C TaxID=1932667 RepID=UPI00117C0AF7|nr:hypothetical protein [Nostoc sp. 106C]
MVKRLYLFLPDPPTLREATFRVFTSRETLSAVPPGETTPVPTTGETPLPFGNAFSERVRSCFNSAKPPNTLLTATDWLSKIGLPTLLRHYPTGDARTSLPLR